MSPKNPDSIRSPFRFPAIAPCRRAAELAAMRDALRRGLSPSAEALEIVAGRVLVALARLPAPAEPPAPLAVIVPGGRVVRPRTGV